MMWALYYLLFAVLFAAPLWRLLETRGYNKYLALGAFIMPAGPVVLLWILAYGDKLKRKVDG